MNPDRAVEILFGDAGNHGNTDRLHHFGRIIADHVRADHALAGLIDNQLHDRAPGAPR